MTGIRIALLMSLSSASILTAATEGELDWNRDYATAKTAAQAARRPLVVVIENPGVEDEKLDDEQMTASDRLKIQQRKIELCRVDASTKYGKAVAEAFGAKKLPFTAVSGQNSKKIVFRKSGQMGASDWSLALAKSSTQPRTSTSVTDFGVPMSSGRMYLQPVRNAVRCVT